MPTLPLSCPALLYIVVRRPTSINYTLSLEPTRLSPSLYVICLVDWLCGSANVVYCCLLLSATIIRCMRRLKTCYY